ncbi:hypothetical protein COU75_00325 [Candidatus Peregrinibacteria bacterium CG10_big_fil_rev_8_21_14_0_10_42_8]|nr:MAG: hypothetical protein COU75_00325 [Candidatus Peregrinibacteria bacterium CG10_big_fil_rev_8_21_14_0_10_42_8]
MGKRLDNFECEHLQNAISEVQVLRVADATVAGPTSLRMTTHLRSPVKAKVLWVFVRPNATANSGHTLSQEERRNVALLFNQKSRNAEENESEGPAIATCIV